MAHNIPDEAWEDSDFSVDPLGLERIDREIRRNERAEQANAWDDSRFDPAEDLPEMSDAILQDACDCQSGPLTSCFAQLTERGVDLPPPDALDDTTLHAKLWEVIHALATFDTYLYHTDHLSDRELYAALWHETLHEAMTERPPGSGWECHFDLLGGGSEEDVENLLRYYSSDEERQEWARDFPDDEMPPHQDPLYDRDRLLPAPHPARHDDEHE
jgi:hypothetical protein